MRSSLAITLNPRPALPLRAAWMPALMASMLVCRLMRDTSPAKDWMAWAFLPVSARLPLISVRVSARSSTKLESAWLPSLMLDWASRMSAR